MGANTLCQIMVETLKTDRLAFNARFAERKLAGSQIDEGAFLEHLATIVDPVVREVSGVFPERARQVVHQLYDISLDLFAASLLGSGARSPHVNELWLQVLPAAANLVARDPSRVAGCLSNAVCNISAQPGTRTSWWISRMVDLAPVCDNVDHLLECGQVLAWQSGMVQYRGAAFEILRRLGPNVAARLIGLSDDSQMDDVVAMIDQIEQDPWLTVETALASTGIAASVKCVRTLGAFRGFGGVFCRPPRVACDDGCICVSDNEFAWDIIADAYGSYLHRRSNSSLPVGGPGSDPRIDVDGNVTWRRSTAILPRLANSTSCAFDGATLAVTLPNSHHVFLLANQ